jgi:hypothetical protein
MDKEKYLDPRWQKKRLTILKRDKFTCQSCKEDDNTLHVHHIEYKEGKEIWEYKNDDLITLCDNCHKLWHYIFNNKLGIDFYFIYPIVDLHKKIYDEKFMKWHEKREKDKKLHPEKYNDSSDF